MTTETRTARETIPAPRSHAVRSESGHRASWMANFGLVCASIVMSLALLEVGARLLLPAPLPWLHPQLRFRPDPQLIFALRPGQEGYTADKITRINLQGLRGPSVPVERDERRLRLLFLGDSITFGYGVADADVVSERVATLMRAHSVPAEVINAAVPAYNTEQEIAYLERDGVQYKPDWVVLGFCWNDIGDKVGVTVSEMGQLLSAEDPSTPALLESQQAYIIRNALKRSRLLYGAVEGWRAVSRLRSSPDMATAMRQAVLEGTDVAAVTDGWSRVEAALHRFRQTSDSAGFRPVVVAFPIPLALQRSFPKSTYPSRLGQIAKQEGLPFIDLEPAFRREYKGHESLFIPYDGDHPNAVGHAIAAREIARTILGDDTAS